MANPPRAFLLQTCCASKTRMTFSFKRNLPYSWLRLTSGSYSLNWSWNGSVLKKFSESLKRFAASGDANNSFTDSNKFSFGKNNSRALRLAIGSNINDISISSSNTLATKAADSGTGDNNTINNNSVGNRP
ncbi:hypothetical protein LP7551_02774 [Roseibium album]|nr:hypothetical protein LP7551_02774 [Roseibium album]